MLKNMMHEYKIDKTGFDKDSAVDSSPLPAVDNYNDFQMDSQQDDILNITLGEDDNEKY